MTYVKSKRGVVWKSKSQSKKGLKTLTVARSNVQSMYRVIFVYRHKECFSFGLIYAKFGERCMEDILSGSILIKSIIYQSDLYWDPLIQYIYFIFFRLNISLYIRSREHHKFI